MKKILAIVLGLIVAVLISELILSHFYPPLSQYHLWGPNMETTLYPNPKYVHGLSDTARFKVNSFGIRGDELTTENYNILAIGGSTTECFMLDQEDMWTQVLQNKLNENSEQNYWVGNAGKSGANAHHHIKQLKLSVQQHYEIDELLIMLGVNDVSVLLGNPEGLGYLSKSEAEIFNKLFPIIPDSLQTLPFYKKTGWYRLAKSIKQKFSPPMFSPNNIMNGTGIKVHQWRNNRKNASSLIDSLPKNFNNNLMAYGKLIDNLIDMAKLFNKPITFATQPTIWRADLDSNTQQLLWMGGVGNFMEKAGQPYYSPAALATAMQMANDTLAAHCQKRNIDLIDLATAIPKNTTYFYDDCHFTVEGAELVAEVLFGELSEL